MNGGAMNRELAGKYKDMVVFIKQHWWQTKIRRRRVDRLTLQTPTSNQRCWNVPLQPYCKMKQDLPSVADLSVKNRSPNTRDVHKGYF